jgi:hypothetical protein
MRCEFYIHFLITSSGKVFLDLRHPEAFVHFTDRARYEKNDLAPRRGYYWGSSSPLKVLKTKVSLAK